MNHLEKTLILGPIALSGDLVKAGFAHYNARRYARALRCFRRAIESDCARNPEVTCYLAHTLHALGRTGEALRELSGLVRASPRYLPGYLNLASILCLQGSFKEADAVLSRAMSLFPGSSEVRKKLCQVLRTRALQCKESDELDQAQRCWSRLASLESRHMEAKRELEDALFKKTQQAKEAGLRRRVAVSRITDRCKGSWNGGIPSPRAERFRALVAVGDYQEAFKVGEQILDGGPTLADLRAFWHPWNPEKFDAVSPEHADILEKMIKRRPKTPWAYYYLGILRRGVIFEFDPLVASPARRYGWMSFKVAHTYLTWGKFKQALSQFKLALRYRPVDWRIHGFLAETYLCLGRRVEAFNELDRAKSSVSVDEFAQLLAWKGAFHLWLGDYRKALGDLDAACRQGSLWAYAWRGGAKIKLGRPREALEDLNMAVKLYPGDREAYVWRGEAKRELGMYRSALKDLSREPISMWAHLNRGLIMGATRDHNGLDMDFGKIPLLEAAYIKKKIGLDLDRELSVKEKLSVLKAGLSLGRGYRHDNKYGNDIWMV